MGKGDDKKLEEIIRLLRRLLSENSKSYSLKRGYTKPRLYKPAGGGGYRPIRNYQSYPRYKASSGSEPKYSSEPKQEKSSSYVTKLWSEPMQYQPKERLIYDPEVRRLLEKIEEHVRREPNAEAALKEVESNPELYEKLVERINEDYEQLEESEALEPEKEDSEKTAKAEPNLEVEEKQGGVEIETEEDLSELEPQQEPAKEDGLPQEVVEIPEPSVDAIEQIEAQDLSSLETELYQEPLEPEAPSEVNAEPSEIHIESELQTEMMDDPVFWQNLENEIIEKQFKKPEPRVEPDAEEYGY